MSERQAERFVEVLKECGGTAGNLRMQSELGWHESTYNRVKEQLLEDGRIVSGRGRGGSVALAAKSPTKVNMRPTSSRKIAEDGENAPPALIGRRSGVVKKSELYASLWASCDELRGGMDASQYKDYVLVLLFIKYVSDKYAGQPYAPIKIPPGASFKDMVALKGRADIGDQINKKIIAPLADSNHLSDLPDFNDAGKLGSGKEMVERLTNLIAIFENRALDFSNNRADGDDILGDAYEYLMRHFATESGKSKGQFYTPAEVSRVMAQIIGIHSDKTSPDTTVYDPTCGSGSLLLKVADQARTSVTLYGQEKDAATSGLARMNMILHNNPTALIVQGNTLADPKFKNGAALKTFDYVVANPPFSDKRWSTGLDPLHDPYGRFEAFGVPPGKQGDYAYLLHIVRSLKSTGKGACILPHGVLFRGNAEGDIRRALIRKGYLKGIIGLPANLFYGTNIPACIVVIDKQHAEGGKGIFMLDASAGYMKDGPKNRLREQDIHKIVDVFTRQDSSDPHYARMVGFDEIEKNAYSLSLPRYIDSQETEDLQDIEGHLVGGIPTADIDALQPYWDVCPQLRTTLFKVNRAGYVDLAVDKAMAKSSIYGHPEFSAFIDGMSRHFASWRATEGVRLKTLAPGFHPKELIAGVAERLLDHYRNSPLVDAYAVYQQVMDYWAATMQDDAYAIASAGWTAEPYRVIETDKKGKQKNKGWACDLVPKPLMVARFFAAEQAAINSLTADLENICAKLVALEEEHGCDEGAYAELDKINRANVEARLREIEGDKELKIEAVALKDWLAVSAQEVNFRRQLKDAEGILDAKVLERYSKLTAEEIKALVVDDKWLGTLDGEIHREIERVCRRLTKRVKELAERYETPWPRAVSLANVMEETVNRHLGKMLSEKRRIKQNDNPDMQLYSEAWRTEVLEKLFAISAGARKSPDLDSGGRYVIMDMGSVSSSGKIVKSKRTDSPKDLLVRGDLVMPKDDIGGGQIIGKVAYIDADNRYVLGDHVYRLQSLNRNISSLFFHFLINSDYVNRALKKKVAGSAQLGLARRSVLEQAATFPSELSEQLAIATSLSDMDAEIEILEAKLSKARQLKQGMMQELLSGRIRIV